MQIATKCETEHCQYYGQFVCLGCGKHLCFPHAWGPSDSDHIESETEWYCFGCCSQLPSNIEEVLVDEG